MSHPLRKWLIILLSLISVAFLTAALLEASHQRDRIRKIDLITRVYQEDDRLVTREQFTDYLRECGARVESSGEHWTIYYDGYFERGVWSVHFGASKLNPNKLVPATPAV